MSILFYSGAVLESDKEAGLRAEAQAYVAEPQISACWSQPAPGCFVVS